MYRLITFFSLYLSLSIQTSGITYQCLFGNMIRTGIQTSDNIITCNIPSGQEVSILYY